MQSGSTPTTENYFKEISTPETKDMELKLEQMVQQGMITPEDAQAALVGESEMGNISLDPRLKAAQMDALSSLQDISGSGGMTNMDKANLSRIASDEAASARGSREAILASAASRGMGGSGLELMSQMQNDQASAGRKSQRDLDVAGMAQQRALDALMKGGQMAGDIQGQDFNRQAQVAGANDAIAKFNAQNQQQVGLTNTGARNAAQAQNVATRQGIADANTNLRNQQQQYNKNLAQTDFNNQLARAGGTQSTANTNAQIQGGNSASSAAAGNQTMGTAISAMAMMSDKDQKKKVSNFDPSDFLENLTSKKYQYKDPGFGKGDRFGTMAQDVEKSEVGRSIVQDTPEGKVINTAEATGPILASLGDLHKRLRDMENEE